MNNQYKLHFVPLGGMTGVTKNMYLYELYKDNLLQDILVVDCGIGFPRSTDLGVDLAIPDIDYLKGKEEKVRAVLLTHGHEDHITALPYHYDALGKPPVFSSRLTALFTENKFKEFGKKININVIDYQREYSLGEFKVRFIRMTHSIPDTTHILIKTPLGAFYHGSDFKLDLNPPFSQPPDFYQITKAGHDGITCLLSDCLGSERDGLTLSESAVGQEFEDEMRRTKGKFIMTTFSSNISRVRQCIQVAKKFNRKVLFLGRSMKENSKLALNAGYLAKNSNLIFDEKEVSRLSPNKVCIIVAGSQGQYNSALSKLSRDQNSYIRIKKGDKIIFSSDPIPGNEEEVYSLIEGIALKGADVVYPDVHEQLHASGHGNAEDLKYLIRLTNPNFLLPIGGTIRHQRQYRKIALSLGYQDNKILLLRDGETTWFFNGNKANMGEKIELKDIFVDAYGIGDIGKEVIGERRQLSSDGFLMVVLVFNEKNVLLVRPKIISKGFIFEKKNKSLLDQAISLIEKRVKTKSREDFEDSLTKNLQSFFFKKKGRKPLIEIVVVRT